MSIIKRSANATKRPSLRMAAAGITAFAALTVPAAAAITPVSATPAATPAAAPVHASTLSVHPSAPQWTAQTLSMTGTWKLVSTFASYKGVPERPGAVSDTVEYVRFAPTSQPLTTFFGDLVYFGSPRVDSSGCTLGGEWYLSPFVSPLGIVVDLSFAGNSQAAADGYTADAGMRAVNTTASPLTFSGYWTDSRGSAGTTTMTRADNIILPPCPTVSPTSTH